MPDLTTLSNELRLAIHRMTRRLRQQHPANDLTLTQVSALSVIWEDRSITAGDLAAKEQVRPPSITRVVDGLAAAGLVERRENPADGRQVLIQITAQGTAKLESFRAARAAWLTEELADLSAKDREVLHRAAAILIEIAAR